MRFNICQKNIIIFCLIILGSTVQVFGQLKNFGTNAKFKPEPNYFFSVYAYADLVREGGVGLQYQMNNKYNMDFSAYLINPNTYFKDKIKQWDYYDLKGYGFSFKPKFQFSKLNRLYVGLNLAYEKLQHEKISVEYFNLGNHSIFYNQEDAKGFGYTVGLTLGNKLSYKQVFFEPFFGIGITKTKLNKTIYNSTNTYNDAKYAIYPQSHVNNKIFFQMNIGLKLGFSFKKSKKHAAIDKKFDDVYIPKANSLNNYIKTIDSIKPINSKYLKEVRNRYKALNRHALAKYKIYYRDTTMFYNKIDTIFKIIDRLIIKGN